jgi:hypothetical protein
MFLAVSTRLVFGGNFSQQYKFKCCVLNSYMNICVILVFMVMIMKIMVIWIVMIHSLVECNNKVEAVVCSEMLGKFYRTTCHHITERVISVGVMTIT